MRYYEVPFNWQIICSMVSREEGSDLGLVQVLVIQLLSITDLSPVAEFSDMIGHLLCEVGNKIRLVEATNCNI